MTDCSKLGPTLDRPLNTEHTLIWLFLWYLSGVVGGLLFLDWVLSSYFAKFVETKDIGCKGLGHNFFGLNLTQQHVSDG
jgi:hypothetical protein